MPTAYPGNQATKPARAKAGGGFESAIDTPAAGALQQIFTDDFSSGDLNKTENGFSWIRGFRATVSTDNPRTGAYSLKARYQGENDPENTASPASSVERDFDLGALYTTVVFEFDLYIPDGTEPYGGARFVHRDGGLGSNNKLFRLWGSGSAGNTYAEKHEHAGASFWNQGTENSYFRFELGNSGGTVGSPAESQVDGFITDADRGEWMTLKFETKMASASGSDGYQKLTKNGVLVSEITTNNRADDPAYDHAYQIGRLFGWHNSGYAEETLLFIDNVKVSGVPK